MKANSILKVSDDIPEYSSEMISINTVGDRQWERFWFVKNTPEYYLPEI